MLTVYVDGRSIDASSLSYSSIDPGGYEQCSFSVTGGAEIFVGSEVRIFEGTETAWHGRVEEPGFQLVNGVATNQVNAVGYGAEFKNNPFSIIYIDKDLTNWSQPSRGRDSALTTANYKLNAGQVLTDEATQLPAIQLFVEDNWVSPYKPISDMLYDAGFGNGISRLYLFWLNGTNVVLPDANWNIQTWPSIDAVNNLVAVTELSTGARSQSIAGFDSRYFVVTMHYENTPNGTQGVKYDVLFYDISVIGSHSIPVQGSDTTRGLLLTDIVKDILKRSKTRFTTTVDAGDFVVYQSVYRTPAYPDEMLEDMRGLCGWHWGVWAPDSTFSSVPSFRFTAPPKQATTYSFVRDCDEFDITQSYARIHNQITASYADVAGKEKQYVLTVKHPKLQGVIHNLDLNVGVSTDDAVQVIARYILNLDQVESRVSGTCVLPGKMQDGRWAHLMQPGCDKIRFPDVPTGSAKVSDPPARVDTFRISRLSVTVNNGKPVTSIEFDQGASLIEVLQARLSQGNASIGL